MTEKDTSAESNKSTENDKTGDAQEPKLVVDTDWKEQVAREKEQAAAAAARDEAGDGEEGPPAASSDAEVTSDATAAADGADAADGEEMPTPPPASFEVLVSMMFTQAMAMLGQMPDPSTGQVTVNKSYAKHYIDTLDMLGEKTQGNLSENESQVLSEALHALRMMYVSAGK